MGFAKDPSVFFGAITAFGLLIASLSGCTGMAVGAGASAGIAAYEERGLEGVARDLKTELSIAEAWVSKDSRLITSLSIEVYEGRALLTGVIDKPGLRAAAVSLAWKSDGVKEVLNEILIKSRDGIEDFAHDSWVSAHLKSALTFDKSVLAINYAIETVSGTVYLIGIAQDKQELNRVIAHAQDTAYVKRVISHVRIKKQR
jgi:osmotically-inducible protein OsmY